MIYLDYASMAPVLPEAAKLAAPVVQEMHVSPRSIYSAGEEARLLLEESRRQTAECLGAEPEEIFFTSGREESNAWAVLGAAHQAARAGKKHLIVSAIEHSSVLQAAARLAQEGFAVTILPVSEEGLVSAAELEAAIRPDTALVSAALANHEIGTIQPIGELAELCRSRGILFHCDGSAAVGNIPVDVKSLGVDFLSLDGGLFGGIGGCGALYCRSGLSLPSLIPGGGPGRCRRGGPENIAGTAAMAAALVSRTAKLKDEMERETALRDAFIDRICDSLPDVLVNGSLEHRLPGNINLSFLGVEGETILMDLDMYEICASTGSVCAGNNQDSTHVLTAIGRTPEQAHSAIRFSFGPETTADDLSAAAEVLERLIPGRRALWGKSASQTSEPAAERAEPMEAIRELDAGTAKAVDVRERNEYAEGHIPGAVLLPLDELERRAEAVLPDKTEPLLVYCKTGNRSEEACRILRKKGYQKARNLGGLLDWPYEIVQEPAENF